MEKIVLGFFVWLFEKCNLHANTFALYRSSLVKPLAMEFNLAIIADCLSELTWPLFNVRPPPTMVEPQWCRTKALNFLKIKRFSVNPFLEDISLKTFSAGSGIRQTCK